MTTLLTSLACLWFAYLIVRAITIEVALRKMAKRNKAKSELMDKIQRKIDRAEELNLHIIDDIKKGNYDSVNQLYSVALDEDEEIKRLIDELNKMG
jgi:chloramphenicol O-acetyltransferase